MTMMVITNEPNMEVKIRISENSIRYGKFSFGTTEGKVPTQCITTTNLNHLHKVGATLDLGTRILEIYWLGNLKDLDDANEFNKISNRFAGILSKNKDKICLLLPQSMRSRRVNKRINLLLIKLQIEAGFKFIKVFLKHNRDAIENLNQYMKLVPQGRFLLPVIDEKLNNEVFKALYIQALKADLPIIGFLGRDLGRNITVNDNHLFIRGRKHDNVIRLISDIEKSTANGNAKSLLFKWLGYDAFTFKTRIGSYHTSAQLRTFRGFKYVPIENNRDMPCVIYPDSKLYDTSDSFSGQRMETVPLSINNIIELNKHFKRLHEHSTEKKLAEMLEPDIRVLGQ